LALGTEPHIYLFCTTKASRMVGQLVCALALCFVHASGENNSPVGSDIQIEEESSGNSLCLLQRELTLNAAPPKYDGPYLNPKPFDRWEKDFIDDDKRGPFFKDTKGASPTTRKPEKRVRTFAPSASALDSLMAPAPVPAPSAPTDFQHLGQSICWSAALFGVIALWAISFLLLNMKSHKGCQMTCQLAISNTIAFFSAKLLFAGMCLFTAAVFERIGGPQSAFQEMLTEDADMLAFGVSLARAGFLYALVHMVQYALCYSGYYHERVVSCASAIGAPLLGFALIDACGVRLRFSDCRSDVTQYVLVAVLATLAVAALFVLHAVCKGAELFAAGDDFLDESTNPDRAHQEHDEQDYLDIESTCFGMVSGFLVFKVAERFILGEQAIARGPLGVQSYDEIQWLLVMAFICAGSTLVVCSLRLECWSMWRNSLVQGSCCWHLVSPVGLHPRVVDWLEASCLMSSAWCLFGAASWSFSGGIFQKTLLQSGFTGAPLFAAFAISVVILVLAVAVGYSKGPGGPPLLHHHGNAVRHSFWIFLVALGLLGGIAWATCFIHAARDLALNFPDYSRSVEGALCCALAVFILPVWARSILPQRKPAAEVAATDKNVKLGGSWETAVNSDRAPLPTVSRPQTQQSMSGGSAAAGALLERPPWMETPRYG